MFTMYINFLTNDIEPDWCGRLADGDYSHWLSYCSCLQNREIVVPLGKQ